MLVSPFFTTSFRYHSVPFVIHTPSSIQFGSSVELSHSLIPSPPSVLQLSPATTRLSLHIPRLQSYP
jgi:hypothetical protein